MNLMKFTLKFLNDESGAVTVDWVVLTAAIVGLGIAVLASVSDGITDLSDDVSESLEHMGDDLDIDYPLHV
ncbi:MAG: hypothetical protein KUG58_07150 [Marinosulfonomonas sp.]|nr:hypothetical protein [Marinosulfonomonas sp.]